MHKNHFAAIVGSVAIFGLINCSSLDQHTSIGTDIIKNTDPSFMDFNGNFHTLSLGAGCVTSAFSLPNKQNSGFGKHPGKFAAGTTGDYRAYSYIQFIVSTSFAMDFDSTDIFDSVTFAFDTLYDTTNTVVGALSPATRFHLYRCDSTNADNLSHTAIPDSAATPDSATATPICTLTQITEGEATWSGKLADTALADSIFNQCRQALLCYSETKGSSYDKISHCDDSLPIRFFVALRTGDDSLVWFKNSIGHLPAMVIHAHHRDPAKDTVIATTDTLRGYPTLVVSETDSLMAGSSSQPLASWLPGRIAVFKLDLKPLWDTMDSTGFDELLSAAFVVKAELLETENNDTIPPVNYFLSADYLTSIDAITDGFQRVNGSIHYNPEINLQAPSEDTELILPIDYHLQHHLDEKPQEFYLYTRLVSSNIRWNQKVLWSKPRFKAVLTTIN